MYTILTQHRCNVDSTFEPGFALHRKSLLFADEDMDYENGVLLLNIFPDFWDLSEVYRLKNGGDNMPHRPPSCSVMIKYLEDQKDIYIGHNAWHEYKFMSYRILKNYNFNYHITVNSKDVVPGHTISMSSYSGEQTTVLINDLMCLC